VEEVEVRGRKSGRSEEGRKRFRRIQSGAQGFFPFLFLLFFVKLLTILITISITTFQNSNLD